MPLSIFEKYGIPTGEAVSIERLYARAYDAAHAGDEKAFFEALPSAAQRALAHYHADEPTPAYVVIERAA